MPSVTFDFPTIEELQAFLAGLKSPGRTATVEPQARAVTATPCSPPAQPAAPEPEEVDLRQQVTEFITSRAHNVEFRKRVAGVFSEQGARKLSEVKDDALGLVLNDLRAVAMECNCG